MGKNGARRRVGDGSREPSVLNFIELRPFTRRWRELGLDDEADLTSLQVQIMFAPKQAPVISGTGGLRKLRFAPTSSRKGKSGSLRVGYVYFESFGAVLLAIIYAKSAKATLSATDKVRIKAAIGQIQIELTRNRERRSNWTGRGKHGKSD